MIQVRELTKHFGDTAALRACTFDVPAGSIVGLVGKNGAGKTTALRILSGQMLPSAGEVAIDGQPLGELDPRWRARVGYLPEMPPLYPEMTVTAYLTYAGRLRRMSEAALRERLETVIAATGLANARRARLGALARGYRQRVGIAQAILHDPPVVLLDEPMTGLDPLQIVHIRDLILQLKPHHTVLFSSHILSEVTQICDRVVLLDQGTVKAQGSEAELRRDLLQRRTLSLLLRGTVARAQEVLGTLSNADVQVREAHEDGTGLVRAEITTADDLRETVSRRCLEGGLGLLEQRELRHGLESLMLQLLEGGGGRAA